LREQEQYKAQMEAQQQMEAQAGPEIQNMCSKQASARELLLNSISNMESDLVGRLVRLRAVRDKISCSTSEACEMARDLANLKF
jgi:hypothetical protein